MRGSAPIALAALAALTFAAPATAARPSVSHARCQPWQQRVEQASLVRLGPLSAGWDTYKEWPNMERFADPETGAVYAKAGLYVRPGTVASLSIAPAYRADADFNYGQGRNGARVLADVVRIRACERRTTFFSGGLIVTGPTCVGIEVRVRGSRRAYRHMVSIDRADTCPVR
jgi:hypothetical protein